MVIRRVTRPEEAMPFVQKLLDSGFSAPMLETREQLNHNLLRALDAPQDFVLGCEADGRLTGIFSLTAEPEERYLEIMLALCEQEDACREVLAFLTKHAPGYQLDCVIHPDALAMRNAFQAAGGLWDPPQQKLRLMQRKPFSHSRRIVPCSEAYRDGYQAIHGVDCYWTAERVLAAPQRFHALVALAGEQVVGYLDVTHGFEENEVYDWFVQEGFRGQGYGAALLDAAVNLNGDRGLTLLCSREEAAALKAAEKLGFATVDGMESMTGVLLLNDH